MAYSVAEQSRSRLTGALDQKGTPPCCLSSLLVEILRLEAAATQERPSATQKPFLPYVRSAVIESDSSIASRVTMTSLLMGKVLASGATNKQGDLEHS